MDQGLELSIWLGMAGVALVSARILLWRTRRVLGRSRQDIRLPAVLDIRVPAAKAAPVGLGVRLTAVPATHPAGSVSAAS